MRQFVFGLLAVIFLIGWTCAETARAVTLFPGDPAPALVASKWVKGEPMKAFEAGKIYVVEFWATWCGPCRESIPHLSELQAKYKNQGVIFIGQDVWEQNQSAVEPFVKQMGDQMNYRVAMDDMTHDKAGVMATTWMAAAGQNGIPCAFLIDRDGKIAWIGHPMNLAPVLLQVLSGNYNIGLAYGTRQMQMARDAKDYDVELRLLDEADKTSDNPQWTKKWRFDALMNKKDYDGANALAAGLLKSPQINARLLRDVAEMILNGNAPDPDFALADKLAQRAEASMKTAGSIDAPLALDLATIRFNSLIREMDYPAACKIAAVICKSPVVEVGNLMDVEWTLAHSALPWATPNFAVPASLLDRAASLTKDPAVLFRINLYRLDLCMMQKDITGAGTAVDEIAKSPQLMVDMVPWLGQELVDQPALTERLLTAAEKNAEDAEGRANVQKARFDILLNRKDYAKAYAVAAAMIDSKDATASVLNEIAWEIATQAGIAQRDLKLAEKIASRANDLSQGKDPHILDTWSRTAFENGDYDKAFALEKQAIELSSDAEKAARVTDMNLYYLRLGRFQDALIAYSKTLHDDPSVVFSWAQVGALQLYLGDEAAYKATCRGMLQRFGQTTDTNEAAQTSKLCLLMPGAVDDMKAVMRLADLGVSAPGYDAPGLTFVLGKGMAEYRAGNYVSAIAWLNRSPAEGSASMPDLAITIPMIQATANFYIAMAEHHLGQDALARSYLAAARHEFETKVPTLQSHHSDVGDVRWIIVKLASREASAMFDSTSPQVATKTH